jgi:hypothetical protein
VKSGRLELDAEPADDDTPGDDALGEDSTD